MRQSASLRYSCLTSFGGRVYLATAGAVNVIPTSEPPALAAATLDSPAETGRADEAPPLD